MNDLQIFKNAEFGNIRTVEKNGQPYFVAADIAKALGYKDATNAIKQHCRWVAKHHIPHPQSESKTLIVNVIPEGDMYRLITNSELPSTERFESWVFDEVLPTIRKHGAYMTPEKIEEVLLNPDVIINLATRLKDEQALVMKLEAKMFEDRPKVIFAESVTASEDSILIGEMAKLLKQNGFNTGQNRFYALLREQGFLIKRKGSDYNLPTQKSIEMGLFEIKETAIAHSDGRIKVEKTAKVTGKGQLYFMNRFKPSVDIAAE